MTSRPTAAPLAAAATSGSLMALERDLVLHSWCVQADWNAPTIVGGRGARFFDASGRSFLDMSSLAECANLGHQHPTVVRAIQEQADVEIVYYLYVVDDEGHLVIVSRASDVIVVRGFSVHPRDVEEVLRQHPFVRDVAVLGPPGASLCRATATVAGRGSALAEATRPMPGAPPGAPSSNCRCSSCCARATAARPVCAPRASSRTPSAARADADAPAAAERRASRPRDARRRMLIWSPAPRCGREAPCRDAPRHGRRDGRCRRPAQRRRARRVRVPHGSAAR